MSRRQIRTLTPTELARVQKEVLIRIVDDDESLRHALRFIARAHENGTVFLSKWNDL